MPIRNIRRNALAEGTVFLLAILSASCSSSAALVLRENGTASLSLDVTIPQAIEAKLRSLSSSGAEASLIDAKALERGAKRQGLGVLASSNPDPSSYRGNFSLDSLQTFIKSSGLGDSGVLEYRRGSGWESLSMRLDGKNASKVTELFPGLDENLLESLQPPALYDNPVSKAEYRSMLLALLGKNNGAAIDDARFTLRIALPGPILEIAGDGVAQEGTHALSVRIPLLDAMVLERGISFYVRWRSSSLTAP